jgi:hypothetical protein
MDELRRVALYGSPCAACGQPALGVAIMRDGSRRVDHVSFAAFPCLLPRPEYQKR